MTINKGLMIKGNLQLQSLKPIVYSRLKNTRKAEHLTNLLQIHESKSVLGTQTSKGTWSCTQHPISKLVAYNYLPSSIQVLLTNLVPVEVLKTM